MALPSAVLAEAEAASEAATPVADAPPRAANLWWRALRAPLTCAGLVVTVLFLVLGVIGPWITPYDPSTISDATLAGPSAAHWLGTTQNGQDIFSQMLFGARASMLVGFGSAVVAMILSVLVGVTSGYLGGLGDELLSLLANVFLVLPMVPLTIILAAYLPHSGSVGIILVISLTSWAWGARVLRAQTLSLRRRDFVEAARATGETTARIIRKDILPNQVAVIAASFLGTVTTAILTQASLAFLGLTDVTQWSWGTILYWAQVNSALLTGSWWWFVPAGLAIALVGTALSLVNFGIDEFINPRLRLAGIGTKKAQRAQARVRRTRRIRQTVQSVRSPAAPFSRDSADVLLDVRHLTVEYVNGDSRVAAVNDVSFTLRRGEVLGIAGESGSGKSTLARLLAQLYPLTSGEVRLHGTPARATRGRAFRDHVSKVQLILQDPYASFNPVATIASTLQRAVSIHQPDKRGTARTAVIDSLLTRINLVPPRQFTEKFPHELSGGQLQRASIARALAAGPDVFLADEPVSSLDVSIRLGVLNLLRRLTEEHQVAMLYVTHDIASARYFAVDTAVMYAGEVVETGPSEAVTQHAAHPYTQLLISSAPDPSRARTSARIRDIGAPPSLIDPPAGCRFHPRCPFAMDRCTRDAPPDFPLSADHTARCWLYADDPEAKAERARNTRAVAGLTTGRPAAQTEGGETP